MDNTIRNWWLFIILGVIFVIAGVFMLARPFETFIVLAQFMAIYFLVTGIFEAIFSITNRNMEGWGWHLFMGLINIVVAVYLLRHSVDGAPQIFLIFLTAFWLLFYGSSVSAFSFAIRKQGISEWWIGLILGIITLLCGIFIMFYPAAGIVLISTIVAVNALILGLFNIFSGFRLRKLR